MSVIMYVAFPHNRPFGEELKNELSGLAQSINGEPGFIWKIWTENQADKTAGGVYMFDTRENAEKYLTMHTERLTKFGYSGISGKVYETNEGLTAINRGPIK